VVTSLTIDRNFSDKDKLDVRMVISTYSNEVKTGAGTAAPAPSSGGSTAGKGG